MSVCEITPKERAEIIHREIHCAHPDSNRCLEFICAQISEAESEALNEVMPMRDKVSYWEEKYQKAYPEGFRAAREKAKAIAEDRGGCRCTSPECENNIARRIGEMMP